MLASDLETISQLLCFSRRGLTLDLLKGAAALGPQDERQKEKCQSCKSEYRSH